MKKLNYLIILYLITILNFNNRKKKNRKIFIPKRTNTTEQDAWLQSPSTQFNLLIDQYKNIKQREMVNVDNQPIKLNNFITYYDQITKKYQSCEFDLSNKKGSVILVRNMSSLQQDLTFIISTGQVQFIEDSHEKNEEMTLKIYYNFNYNSELICKLEWNTYNFSHNSSHIVCNSTKFNWVERNVYFRDCMSSQSPSSRFVQISLSYLGYNKANIPGNESVLVEDISSNVVYKGQMQYELQQSKDIQGMKCKDNPDLSGNKWLQDYMAMCLSVTHQNVVSLVQSNLNNMGNPNVSELFQIFAFSKLINKIDIKGPMEIKVVDAKTPTEKDENKSSIDDSNNNEDGDEQLDFKNLAMYMTLTDVSFYKTKDDNYIKAHQCEDVIKNADQSHFLITDKQSLKYHVHQNLKNNELRYQNKKSKASRFNRDSYDTYDQIKKDLRPLLFDPFKGTLLKLNLSQFKDDKKKNHYNTFSSVSGDFVIHTCNILLYDIMEHHLFTNFIICFSTLTYENGAEKQFMGYTKTIADFSKKVEFLREINLNVLNWIELKEKQLFEHNLIKNNYSKFGRNQIFETLEQTNTAVRLIRKENEIQKDVQVEIDDKGKVVQNTQNQNSEFWNGRLKYGHGSVTVDNSNSKEKKWEKVLKVKTVFDKSKQEIANDIRHCKGSEDDELKEIINKAKENGKKDEGKIEIYQVFCSMYETDAQRSFKNREDSENHTIFLCLSDELKENTQPIIKTDTIKEFLKIEKFKTKFFNINNEVVKNFDDQDKNIVKYLNTDIFSQFNTKINDLEKIQPKLKQVNQNKKINRRIRNIFDYNIFTKNIQEDMFNK